MLSADISLIQLEAGELGTAPELFALNVSKQEGSHDPPRHAARPTMITLGPHERVHEYDGAYRCMACHSLWGAITGDPPMPKKCFPSRRRHVTRRITDRRQPDAVIEQGRSPESREASLMVAQICAGAIVALCVIGALLVWAGIVVLR